MDVSSASFSYPRLDGAARAGIARALLGGSMAPGVFVLSTCLRVEVAVAGGEVDLKGSLDHLIGPTSVEPELRFGAPAVHHLFRVAAGLESPIVGEVEVLTQFRQAVADLREAGPVEGAFLKILESAVATGRRAREAMGTSPHDTMAALAAQMVGMHPEVAVVGSGTMAGAVVDALGALPAPPNVTMVARNPRHVSHVQLDVMPMSELGEVISGFPAIVSATAASSGLMDDEVLVEALRGRSSPLTLVDMAMPPDFIPPPEAPVSYVGIDDLARMARRRGDPDGVAAMVAAASEEAYRGYVQRDKAGPVIASMLAAGDAVVSETVERFAGKLSDPADRDVLQQVAHTVARAILYRPVSTVRSSGDPGVIEALASAFDDE